MLTMLTQTIQAWKADGSCHSGGGPAGFYNCLTIWSLQDCKCWFIMNTLEFEQFHFSTVRSTSPGSLPSTSLTGAMYIYVHICVNYSCFLSFQEPWELSGHPRHVPQVGRLSTRAVNRSPWKGIISRFPLFFISKCPMSSWHCQPIWNISHQFLSMDKDFNHKTWPNLSSVGCSTCLMVAALLFFRRSHL